MSLEKEYAQMADALSNWFISQDIPVPKACGVMMWLAGTAIGESARDRQALVDGLARHVVVLASMADRAFDKKGER